MRTLGSKAVLLKAAGLCTVLLTSQAWAADEPAENASNPLAKGRNTDLRYQAFDVDDQSHQQTVSIEGAFMALPDLKIKYEAHYSETDVTGSSERGWEQFSLKGIYFPKEGRWGKWGYRVAVGLEWLIDGGNSDLGIGTGADQLGPFVGLALTPRQGTTLIPLIQHFESYRGADVSVTAARLIAMQTLSRASWIKLDGIFPYDWDRDAVPANIELQYGRNLSNSLALFVDGLVGLGSDRPYDYGFGVGVRFIY